MSLLSSNKKKEKPAKAPKPPKVKKEKKTKAKKGADEAAAPKKGKKEKKEKVVKERPPKKKVPANVYTLVLLVAWLALTAACVLAYLDLASYK